MNKSLAKSALQTLDKQSIRCTSKGIVQLEKIFINGSVGFNRSVRLCPELLMSSAHQIFPVRCIHSFASCCPFFLQNNTPGYFQGYLFWPRSERRLILLFLSFLFHLTPLKWNFLWNWLFSFAPCDGLFVACHFMNAWLLLSKQQATRIFHSIEWNKKSTEKIKWKKQCSKNGLTPNA